MTDRGYYFPTLKGRRFYPSDPQPGDFDLEEIAHALSMICRFGGQIRSFYSVGQHSVLVGRAVFGATGNHALALYGLLHDAAEAYIGDVVWPVKHASEMRGYKVLEQRVESALRRQFGLHPVQPDVVKHYDLVLLATEKRDLREREDPHVRHEHDLARSSYGLHADIAPLSERIEPWDMQTAEYTFLDDFRVWSHP